MLPRVNRLTKEQDFKRLALRGRFFFGRFFNIKALRGDIPDSRFGIVISAKVSKKATVRNLLKRRLTEVIRLDLPNILPGFELMIVVTKEAIDLDYATIKDNLEAILKKIGILVIKRR